MGARKDQMAVPIVESITTFNSNQLDLAASKCREVFVRYVPCADRMSEILLSGDASLSLQLLIYHHGTNSPVTVAERARKASAFFEDMRLRKWKPTELTVWQAAE